ncbi:MAG: O-antigen ligase family protein [Anaerolineales bacterium]|nr:O-antigen ligase family protein [Anaerolineales bacterium]
MTNLSKFFWALTMLTLPVTSFRWFPFLGESTLVRPLALLPLVFLFPILLFQFWKKEIKLQIPNAMVALSIFVLFTLVSTSLGALINPIPLRGQMYDGRAIRALATLFIGIAFFVSAVWMNKNEEDLKFTVKWIFAGLIITIAWSGLQAITFYTDIFDRETITKLQLSFSMRELVRTNRISGLAYEPAWLAGQLATIFIPFLFASILTNYHITKYKWLEPVLLVLSLIVALGTFSRGGLLTIVASAGLTFLFLGRDVIKSVWHWFIGGFRKKVIDIVFRFGIISIIFASLFGAFAFLSQREIFSNLWQADAETLDEFIVQINAGSRGAYSSAGYGVFENYPITGVGLGASGFTMYQNLPDWSLTSLPEIARQLSPESRLYPNPKNFYIRLLAETGLIGFFLFLAFHFHILGDALSLLKQNQTWTRFATIAGVFAWLAITFYNATQDSFATPNIWLVSGIMVGLSTNLFKENV